MDMPPGLLVNTGEPISAYHYGLLQNINIVWVWDWVCLLTPDFMLVTYDYMCVCGKFAGFCWSWLFVCITNSFLLIMCVYSIPPLSAHNAPYRHLCLVVL